MISISKILEKLKECEMKMNLKKIKWGYRRIRNQVKIIQEIESISEENEEDEEIEIFEIIEIIYFWYKYKWKFSNLLMHIMTWFKSWSMILIIIMFSSNQKFIYKKFKISLFIKFSWNSIELKKYLYLEYKNKRYDLITFHLYFFAWFIYSRIDFTSFQCVLLDNLIQKDHLNRVIINFDDILSIKMDKMIDIHRWIWDIQKFILVFEVESLPCFRFD